MICYVHAREGLAVHAVATCKSCGVGVCLEHLTEMQANRPGGMEIGCSHVLPQPSDIGTPRPRIEPVRL
jgi:hypothetical protein